MTTDNTDMSAAILANIYNRIKVSDKYKTLVTMSTLVIKINTEDREKKIFRVNFARIQIIDCIIYIKLDGAQRSEHNIQLAEDNSIGKVVKIVNDYLVPLRKSQDKLDAEYAYNQRITKSLEKSQGKTKRNRRYVNRGGRSR